MIHYTERANDRGVYSIRCTATGAAYVGASGSVQQRWYQHKSALKCGKHYNPALQAEWDAHGPDAFVFELLEYVADPACLVEREQEWIERLGTANLRPAGVGGRPGRTFCHSDEVWAARNERRFEDETIAEWAMLEVLEEYRAAGRRAPDRYATYEERRAFENGFKDAVDARKREIKARLGD